MTQAERYTLHCVDEDVYVVIARDIAGNVIGGHAGFAEKDIPREGEETDLSQWEFLELTANAAQYVAATFPVVLDQQ